MSRERNGQWDVLKPYPRQLEALRLSADGRSITQIAEDMDLSHAQVGSLLSHAYSRLKIDTGLPKPGTSPERRWKAIKICRDQGWLPETVPDSASS